jgi:hypothetical protein
MAMYGPKIESGGVGSGKPKKLTVSQAMIDRIKADGMTASLKKAGTGAVSASYLEGVKRMYGAKRLAAATAKNAAGAKKAVQKKVAAKNEKMRPGSKFK